MNKTDLQFFLNENIQIDLRNFVLNLFVAIILSFLIQLVYNKTSRSLSNAENFSRNFIVLGLTTTIVITIVKTSLALSLGLVGALSIVRFRAAIKEPEELVFLFLIIAVGLGCGAGQIKITAIGTLIAIIIIFIMYFSKRNRQKITIDRFNISLILNKKLDKNNLKKIIDLVSNHSSQSEFISISQDSDGTTVNLLSKFDNFNNINKLKTRINKNFPETNFVFVRDNSNAI
jgi:ribose/xylose/arabinose/galactoside ABC-type transport system permease subunit